MRTIKTTLYQFDELSETAKDKAIEDLSDINVDYEWYDSVYEDARAIGDILGITIKDIWFSGFYHQGEGSSFDGSYSYKKNAHHEIANYAPMDTVLHRIAWELFDLQRRHFYKLSAVIKSQHSNYNSVETYKDGYELNLNWYGKEFTSLMDAHYELTETLDDFNNWIFDRLKDEYEYLTSDEAIIDAIRANEYEFTENGEFV